MSDLTNQEKVLHEYHDHSHVTDSANLLGQGVQTNEAAPPRPDQNLNFPVRLHYMLSELEADGLSHIVSWQPHGRCFLVHNQQRFVDEILPLWFRQSRYPSFQRQLNLYGFKRLSTARDKGAYYHELFLRGKRFLAYRIDRIKIKGTGARKPSSPETEPNFYLTPFLPPSPPEKQKNTTEPALVVAAVPQPQDSAASLTFGGASFSTSTDVASLQRLLAQTFFSSSIPETSLPMSLTSGTFNPLAGTALLLEAQRAQLASQLVLQHFQKQQADAMSLERLTIMLGRPVYSESSFAAAAALMQRQQLKQDQDPGINNLKFPF